MSDWTWIIYLAGDNNLEGAGYDDLKEMQEIGSSDRLNLIVQFDTEVGGATRYRVERNALSTVQKMPGVNTGRPETLSEFISWAMKKYPAKHYLLDVWNHGGGWENLPADFNYDGLRAGKPLREARLQRLKRSIFRTTAEHVLALPEAPSPASSGRARRGPGRRAIAIDTGSHDYLDNQELQRAVSKAFGAAKADILGCDACLMNMLEIAYEMRATSQFMVGSEETEPAAGWPYASVLKQLAATPAMSPSDLAKLIVREYRGWYDKNGSASDGAATQSAFDLSKIDQAVAALDDLAGALTSELSSVAGAVSLALAGAQKFRYPEYVDLGSFASQLVKKLPARAKSRAPANALLKVLANNDFVVANATWGDSAKRATGVTVYFPKPEEYSPDYDQLELSQNAKWMPFLKAFNAAAVE